MADSTEDKAEGRKAAPRAAAAEPEPAAPEAPTYHVDRLIAESTDFFGVESHVLEGALALKGGTKKNLTREEAQDAIDAYLGHEETSGEEQ